MVVMDVEMGDNFSEKVVRLEERALLELSSDSTINLLEHLDVDSRYVAVSSLFSRKGDAELLWQIKCLKKLIELKQREGATSKLTTLIDNYIKGRIGEQQLYGLIFLIHDTGFVLPDELVKRLVIVHQSNHWIPLLTEKQRLSCFDELLRRAETDKEYINVVNFLSLDKEKAKEEVKLIVADILKKYGHLFTQEANEKEDNLTVLKTLSVLILCFNDQKHQEIYQIITKKLNDKDKNTRKTILEIIAVCVPYFNDQEREKLFNAIHERLEDREPGVRFAAQKAITLWPHRDKIESPQVLSTEETYKDQQEEILLQLASNEWSTRKEALLFLVACLPNMSDVAIQELLPAVLDKLQDESLLVREEALKTLALCMPYFTCDEMRQKAFAEILLNLKNDHDYKIRETALQAIISCISNFNDENHQQILDVILPNLDDKDWSCRYMVLQAMFLLIPHLNSENHQKVLDAILPKLNDNNSLVRSTVLQDLMQFIPELQGKNHQKILNAILPKLNDDNSYVSSMARKAITSFMPCLNSSRIQGVLDALLVKVKDHDFESSEAALQDIVACIPHITDERRIELLASVLPALGAQDEKVVRAAMQTLIAFIPYLHESQHQPILDAVFSKLHDENWEVCEGALRIILTCSIYRTEEERIALYEQLAEYLKQNSLISWCGELLL